MHLPGPDVPPDMGKELGTTLRDLARKPLFWLVLVAILLMAWLGSSNEDAMTVLLWVGMGILLYFLPALIARKKPNANSVFVINFFLGWTLIGWVVALAMALNNPSPNLAYRPVSTPAIRTGRTCPFCAEDIQPAAIVCKHCGRDLPPSDLSAQELNAAPQAPPPAASTSEPQREDDPPGGEALSL